MPGACRVQAVQVVLLLLPLRIECIWELGRMHLAPGISLRPVPWQFAGDESGVGDLQAQVLLARDATDVHDSLAGNVFWCLALAWAVVAATVLGACIIFTVQQEVPKSAMVFGVSLAAGFMVASGVVILCPGHLALPWGWILFWFALGLLFARLATTVLDNVGGCWEESCQEAMLSAAELEEGDPNDVLSEIAKDVPTQTPVQGQTQAQTQVQAQVQGGWHGGKQSFQFDKSLSMEDVRVYASVVTDSRSVGEVVGKLNSGEMNFRNGRCIVFSESQQRYMLLFRSDTESCVGVLQAIQDSWRPNVWREELVIELKADETIDQLGTKYDHVKSRREFVRQVRAGQEECPAGRALVFSDSGSGWYLMFRSDKFFEVAMDMGFVNDLKRCSNYLEKPQSSELCLPADEQVVPEPDNLEMLQSLPKAGKREMVLHAVGATFLEGRNVSRRAWKPMDEAWRLLVLLLVAISVQNIPEGLALAVAALHGHAALPLLKMLVILAVIEGVAIALAAMTASGGDKLQGLLFALYAGICIVLGALSAIVSLQTGSLSAASLLAINAIVAGVVCYLATVELLPFAAKQSQSWFATGFVLGSSMMLLLQAGLVLEIGRLPLI